MATMKDNRDELSRLCRQIGERAVQRANANGTTPDVEISKMLDRRPQPQMWAVAAIVALLFIAAAGWLRDPAPTDPKKIAESTVGGKSELDLGEQLDQKLDKIVKYVELLEFEQADVQHRIEEIEKIQQVPNSNKKSQ